MTRPDPQRDEHKAWLGLLQPVGLVVSPIALVRAQAIVDRNVHAEQLVLQALVAAGDSSAEPLLQDFPRFATELLGWMPEDLAGSAAAPAIPAQLELNLTDYGETLRPNFAALDPISRQALLLVTVTDAGCNLDRPLDEGVLWHASPQARFERLLRHTGVPAGLLCNGQQLRLVYAPAGESSGHVSFPIGEMCTVGGRILLSALLMLLGEHRVFSARDGARLLDLLQASRAYQNEVSSRLSEQVLDALWQLLRGFQAADDLANGRVLHDLPRANPQALYGGLLTVIMRLIFLRYAEDQGLMPASPIFARNYSVGGLYERLREDAGRFPDTMDQRFGAWAALLSTFRLIYDGASHDDLHLPARHGQLFDPDQYPFLEGRPPGIARVQGDTFEAPRVSDGVIWRVLERLLVLDGERLSYRGLDVEHVGSVYESMMGFDVQLFEGPALAISPRDIVVDLDELLRVPPARRAAWLEEQAECKLPASAAEPLKRAVTANDCVAAIGRRASHVTPHALPPGALVLQPGLERRRSGSHYTPRELTRPIVHTTLAPVLAALGPSPTPAQILDLKICDPAMGSGAFLVEACRQLAAALVLAWEQHRCMPAIPPDEDPLLHARRLVVQRCIYGVDRNPFAVNLAKLSLWLVTLARDHAFTFLDHCLKHGDSLVGLTPEQIGYFHWKALAEQDTALFANVGSDLASCSDFRKQLHALGDTSYDEQSRAWHEAELVVRKARRLGDLCIAAFFDADNDRERERLRGVYSHLADMVASGQENEDVLDDLVKSLRTGPHPTPPLHWPLEFPEVFGRPNAGFDAIVGNPPFAGKNNTIAGNRTGYLDWLKVVHPDSHGNADLVAHFFRRAFTVLREGGTFGLIATNTIGQGDTRETGLRHVCTHGGNIYSATRRLKWPGLAAVVVSVVHVRRGEAPSPRVLDGREVPFVSAFLFSGGGHENPATLLENAGKSFVGSYILGMGFTFDDTDSSGTASPLAEMHRLIEKDPRNAERIFPYLGGHEINSSPKHSHHRYAINFGEMAEQEARKWPDLVAVLEAKVKPERLKLHDRIGREFWWKYSRARPELAAASVGLDRVLVIAQTSSTLGFAFVASRVVCGHTVIVFPTASKAAFGALQSSVHRIWVEMFAAPMKDDARYIPSDCFETFPFPKNWTDSPALEEVGRAYYEYRAALMVERNEGLTTTYNRFHNPDENSREIEELRRLHAEMDQAVLQAYGWTDLDTTCNFELEYEIDEAEFKGRKKPYRYRWSETTRNEILSRLLAENAARHEAELALGGAPGAGPGAGAEKKGRAKKAGKAGTGQGTLL